MKEQVLIGKNFRGLGPNLKRIPTKLFQIYSRFVRGKTLGARVCAIDGQGRVLLIRHSYTKGWGFPGGGVDKGETLKQAAIRELREEAAVEATGELVFHGMFSNEDKFPGDHVALFICREFKLNVFKPNLEIVEAKFFARDEFPPDLTMATRQRLAEIFDGAVISEHWIT
jgi:8-oxo-dGTP pyrophosphatase MutT (NUDIX family)